MKNSNYSPHRGIVRVFGKRATKQNGNGEPFYLQKHPLKKTAFRKGNLLPG